MLANMLASHGVQHQASMFQPDGQTESDDLIDEKSE